MELTIDIGNKYIVDYPLRATRADHFAQRPFFKLIRPGQIGAEIGVLEGFNAEHILKHNEPKLLYLIDSYKKYEDIIGDLSAFSQEIFDEIFKNVNLRFEGKPVKFLRMDSVAAAAEIEDGSLDFCYIDADHRREAVIRDIKIWMAKIKPDGLIGGHDAIEIEVNSAIRQLEQEGFFKGGIIKSEFNDWWIENE